MSNSTCLSGGCQRRLLGESRCYLRGKKRGKTCVSWSACPCDDEKKGKVSTNLPSFSAASFPLFACRVLCACAQSGHRLMNRGRSKSATAEHRRGGPRERSQSPAVTSFRIAEILYEAKQSSGQYTYIAQGRKSRSLSLLSSHGSVARKGLHVHLKREQRRVSLGRNGEPQEGGRTSNCCRGRIPFSFATQAFPIVWASPR